MSFFDLNLRSTEHQKRWWKNRQIDWQQAYGIPAMHHPHRYILVNILKQLPWRSLIEVGCGAGANLALIVASLKDKQVGGIDINSSAIEVCQRNFKRGLFKVGSIDDIMLSDKSTDIVLSDMCLIYVGPFKIRKYLEEMKRITRNYIVLCEFHSEKWWLRLWLRLRSGYHAYNYKKLLDSCGFYDISYYKLRPADWPGGQPQETFGWVFIARIPKR